jgi:hypothetical protein
MMSATNKSGRVCIYLVVDIPNVINCASESDQRLHLGLVFFKQILVGSIACLQCHPLIPELGVGASTGANFQSGNRLSKSLMSLLLGQLLGTRAATAERDGKKADYKTQNHK